MNLRHGVYYILRFFSRLIFGRNFLIRNKKVAKIYIILVKSLITFHMFTENKNVGSSKILKHLG